MHTRRMQSICGRAQRAEEAWQGRLRLRVALGRMRTDRGRLMTYKHTNKIAIEFTSTGSLRSPNDSEAC